MACMEDVLDLYAEPYDPKRPVVNFDESSKQLVAEKRTPIPPKRGRRERFDYEYKRNGTRNLFMCCEPLAGWRHVAVTQRRTMVDFAHQMRWLVDEAYPEAENAKRQDMGRDRSHLSKDHVPAIPIVSPHHHTLVWEKGNAASTALLPSH